MTKRTINIARDFNPYPSGRYPSHGEHNGETFREKFLIPALEKGCKITIVLDNLAGYPSGFLEEAFGGLVREGYPKAKIKETFIFVFKEDFIQRYVDDIHKFIDEAYHYE